MDVVCLGLAVCDILVKPFTPEKVKKGELTKIDTVDISTGGDAFNQAIDLSKLGINASILAKIGNDKAGDIILNAAQKNNLSTEGLSVSEDCNTTCSVVLIAEDGERSFLYSGGACEKLSIEDIDFELIKKAKVLSIGSALALPGLDGAALTKVLEKAKEFKVTTVLDVKGESCKKNFEKIKGALKYTDFFMPNYQEAQGLTGKSDLDEIADTFFSMGAKTVIVKLGDEGCFVATPDNKTIIPSFKVQAVDTTGAGDSFVAGFVASYVRGYSLLDCIKFANAVGSHCVRKVGATNGIPSFDEIEKFLEEQNI